MLICFAVISFIVSFVSAEWREFSSISSKTANFSVFSESSTKQSDQVTLYDHDNYQGDSVTVRLATGECTSLLHFNDRATSIKIAEGCVRLWMHSDCEGRSLDILAPGEPDLQTKDFNDHVTSISSCDYPCIEFKENVEIVMHLNGANDLARHAALIKRMMLEWFPKIQGQLFTPAYKTIDKIDVYFDINDEGIYAIDREIHIPQNYVRNNKGDTGVFIHELTHVIHQARGGCPDWVVEGTAEYMRRWFYEPMTTPTKPRDETLSNPYVGDWLLVYLNTYLKRPIFYMITKACQEGSWRSSWLKDVTGKDEQEWWRQMVRDDKFPWKRVR